MDKSRSPSPLIAPVLPYQLSVLCVGCYLLWAMIAGCSTPADERVVPTDNQSKEQVLEEEPVESPTAITFDDLDLDMKPESKFDPQSLGEHVKAFAGKRVRIKGVLHPSSFPMPKGSKYFVLLRNKSNQSGRGMRADQQIEVIMKAGLTISYTPNTVQVEGILRISPRTNRDGNTISIYQLEESTAQPQ